MPPHKQHLPVFVGSTFEDMKDYRAAVQQSLVQLEAIVRGMEHFGSKPGSPVDECLEVVRGCKIYIGLFAMRYGFVPDGHEKSMTHLEYDEAQRLSLPSLIYLIDETNQPILPKFVETGPGADKLRALKETLRKRHVISTFTTTADLAARIRHDIPQALSSLGTNVVELRREIEGSDDVSLLEEFDLMPKTVAGREVVVEIEIAEFRTPIAEQCQALNLELGATISSHVTVNGTKKRQIYASRDVAQRLRRFEKGTKIRVKATLAFGVSKAVDWSDDGPIVRLDDFQGLVIRDTVDKSVAEGVVVELPNKK